jgi:hypothetical protein
VPVSVARVVLGLPVIPDQATASAVPAVAGLPILTVCAEPPDGVTVKLPSVPSVKEYVVFVFVV